MCDVSMWNGGVMINTILEHFKHAVVDKSDVRRVSLYCEELNGALAEFYGVGKYLLRVEGEEVSFLCNDSKVLSATIDKAQSFVSRLEHLLASVCAYEDLMKEEKDRFSTLGSKWDAYFMKIARECSSLSKDPSTKVGAVIVDRERRIVSTGYNGFSRGDADHSIDYECRELKCKKIIHAEANAIIQARRDLSNTVIYVYPFFPCSTCASLIANAGIREVVVFADDDLERASRWRRDHIVAMDTFRMNGIRVGKIHLDRP